MIGDGVNDVLVIKIVDIGIVMGIIGIDVVKEVFLFVLLDDNFVIIKLVIKEGRNIYENICKFICYLLVLNVGEILVMLFVMLFVLLLLMVFI